MKFVKWKRETETHVCIGALESCQKDHIYELGTNERDLL